MLETSRPRLSIDKKQLLELAKRLLEARDLEADYNLPSQLTTDAVIVSLIEIATIPADHLPQMQRQVAEPIKRSAVSAVRVLISGLIQGGLPAKKAYGLFSLEDLNLLFYVHSRLAGSDQYPDIPIGYFCEVLINEQ